MDEGGLKWMPKQSAAVENSAKKIFPQEPDSVVAERSVSVSIVHAHHPVDAQNSVSNLVETREKFVRQLMKNGLHRPAAEDLFHSSLMQVILHLDELRDHTKLEAWFRTILRNRVNDYFRQLKKERLIENSFDTNEDSFEGLERDLCKCCFKLLDSLKNELSNVLKYRYLEGKNVKDTADLLGISENLVKVRSHRAKEKMREMIKSCCGIKNFSETFDCECE